MQPDPGMAYASNFAAPRNTDRCVQKPQAAGKLFSRDGTFQVLQVTCGRDTVVDKQIYCSCDVFHRKGAQGGKGCTLVVVVHVFAV